jgi:hypothetical protein
VATTRDTPLDVDFQGLDSGSPSPEERTCDLRLVEVIYEDSRMKAGAAESIPDEVRAEVAARAGIADQDVSTMSKSHLERVGVPVRGKWAPTERANVKRDCCCAFA